MDPIIKLNVGGRHFETYQSTLLKYPHTTLARMITSSLAKTNDQGEYFFDRNSSLFDTILDIYRTGQINCPHHINPQQLREELTFWGFDVPDNINGSDGIYKIDEILSLLLICAKSTTVNSWEMQGKDADRLLVAMINDFIAIKKQNPFHICSPRYSDEKIKNILQTYFNIEYTIEQVEISFEHSGYERYYYVTYNNTKMYLPDIDTSDYEWNNMKRCSIFVCHY
jgi:hypothetical protein